MADSSQTPAKVGNANENARSRLGRRGLKLAHWLLIVVFAALIGDIYVRVTTYRKTLAEINQKAAATASAQHVDSQIRQFLEATEANRLQAAADATRRETLEKLRRSLEEAQQHRDSTKGNIIPLSNGEGEFNDLILL
jgi:hypothetical protein